MGFPKKHQVQLTKESQGKKWVFAGIALRAPLKPVSTKVRDGGEDGEESTTPTARESRIPERMACPEASRKRRPVSTCQADEILHLTWNQYSSATPMRFYSNILRFLSDFGSAL